MFRRILFAVLIAVAVVLMTAFPVLAAGEETNSDVLGSFSNLDLWAIFVGAVTSFVAGIINRSRWRDDVRFGVFAVLSVLTAAGTTYFKGDLSEDYKRTFLLVAVAGILTYKATKGAVKSLEDRTG